jgi:AAA15 family ATPase/GTPase
MFASYLELTNFKSFSHFKIDFDKKENSPKQIAFIYGENGSGKTTIVDAFAFLKSTIFTISTYFSFLKEYLKKSVFFSPNDGFNRLDELISNIRPIESGEEELTKLLFHFLLDGKKYIYMLSLSAHQVVSESLSYPIAKNLTVAFSFSRSSNKTSYEISPTLFKDASIKKRIDSFVKDFSGKNTFLSFIYNELRNSPLSGPEKAFDQGFIDFIQAISKIRILKKDMEIDYIDGDTEMYSYPTMLHNYNSNSFFLPNLFTGRAQKNKSFEVQKQNTITALSSFVKGLSSSFAGVTYKIAELKDIRKKSYSLFFIKNSHGKTIEVPFERESRGNIQLVAIFSYLVSAATGDLVIADEIDEGIHEYLFSSVVKSLFDDGSAFKGQLIATCHNLTAMGDAIPKQSIYILDSSKPGEDPIARSVDEYGIRLQENNNIESKYYQGVFGGIPYPGYFSFSEIAKEINKKDGK